MDLLLRDEAVVVRRGHYYSFHVLCLMSVLDLNQDPSVLMYDNSSETDSTVGYVSLADLSSETDSTVGYVSLADLSETDSTVGYVSLADLSSETDNTVGYVGVLDPQSGS